MADWIMVDKLLISSKKEGTEQWRTAQPGTDWEPSLGGTDLRPLSLSLSLRSQISDLKTFSKILFLNVK